jgi:hypothetical protein
MRVDRSARPSRSAKKAWYGVPRLLGGIDIVGLVFVQRLEPFALQKRSAQLMKIYGYYILPSTFELDYRPNST